jgi:hypothetical protein
MTVPVKPSIDAHILVLRTPFLTLGANLDNSSP